MITLSYPFEIGAEQSFLEQELRYCRRSFDEVLLLPTLISDRKYALPEGISVDISLAQYAAKTSGWVTLFARVADRPLLLLRELLSAKVLVRPWVRGKVALKNYLLLMSYLRFLRLFDWRGDPAIIYTYWFTPVTGSAALYAKEKKHIRVISRAHGLDLYENRNRGYMPFRGATLAGLDGVALVSEQARHYLSARYPNYAHKFVTHVIGSADEQITAIPSANGGLSLVSCSTLDANKRVHLIVEALAHLLLLQPQLSITWHHFGQGPLQDDIARLAKQMLPNHVKVQFHGQVNHDQIMDFYRTSPADLFITTSASEGGRPLSIAEALSCSVPVLASAVGGIPELVDSTNGFLLDANPSPETIANAIVYLISNAEELAARRRQARLTWEQRCDARSVCPLFVSYLDTLCKQPI